MYEYNGGGVCHAYEKLGYGVDMWGGASLFIELQGGVIDLWDVMGGWCSIYRIHYKTLTHVSNEYLNDLSFTHNFWTVYTIVITNSRNEAITNV